MFLGIFVTPEAQSCRVGEGSEFRLSLTDGIKIILTKSSDHLHFLPYICVLSDIIKKKRKLHDQASCLRVNCFCYKPTPAIHEDCRVCKGFHILIFDQ